MRGIVLILAALSAPAFARARESYFYECKIERPAAVGELEASARLSEDGVPDYVSMSWSWPSDLSPLSLSAYWSGRHGQQSVDSFASYSYGQRRQRIRLELANGAGDVLLRSGALTRNRYRAFIFGFPWETLIDAARRAGVLHVRAVEEAGRVLSERSLSSAQLEQVDREAEQLSQDFDAMLANYRSECENSRDWIIV